MSLNARKRSKWDTKEEHPYMRRNVEECSWSERDASAYENKTRGWHSEAVDADRSKWSSIGRGSRRSENFQDHHNRIVSRWDDDESYGSRMSPGLDEWRFQNLYRSPKSDWRRDKRSRSRSNSKGRSRSRSPMRGIRRDYGSRDKSKETLCRNFAAGRCRRGDQCWFLHHDSENQDDRFPVHPKNVAVTTNPRGATRDRLDDRQRSGDWCDDTAEGNYRNPSRFSRISGSNEELTELKRESNERNRDLTLEKSVVRDSNQASEVLCKFYAAGRCRNGTNCRFSHVRSHSSPSRWSSNEDLSHNHVANERDKQRNGPLQINDLNASSVNNKLRSDQNGNLAVSEQAAACWSVSDEKPPSSIFFSKEVDMDFKHLNSDTDGFGDKPWIEPKERNQIEDVEMSPEWNYKMSSSNATDKGDDASLLPTDSKIIPPIINDMSSISQSVNLREKVASSGQVMLPANADSFGNPLLQKSQADMTVNELELRDPFAYQMSSGKTINQKMFCVDQSPNNRRFSVSTDPYVSVSPPAKSLLSVDPCPPSNDVSYSLRLEASESNNHQRQENILHSNAIGEMGKEQTATAEQDNGVPENIVGEKEKGDTSKKTNDAKALRSFKFALAEFVKELMKPKWKEGQMSKESYKLIVKKVVDKVTHTMQSANVPQTQEKIDQYLSASKPKLAKLVQAYVEKLQKEK